MNDNMFYLDGYGREIDKFGRSIEREYTPPAIRNLKHRITTFRHYTESDASKEITVFGAKEEGSANKPGYPIAVWSISLKALAFASSI